jgi:hypothetical protein
MTEPFADDAATQAALAFPGPDFVGQEPPVLTPPPSVSAPEPPAPEPEPEADPYDEKIPEFDPKWKQAFSGLLYIGSLTETFSLYGHEFTIATPSQTEFLQIGLVIEPYQNTIMAEIAYQMARVAAYLVSVDGQPLAQPITTDPKETALDRRFRWVTDTLKRELVNKLNDKCLEMDAKMEGALEAMGKALG